MIDLSKTTHPDFALLSKGTLMTGNPSLPEGQAAFSSPESMDRAIRSLRFRTWERQGSSLVDALHAVDSNLDTDGVVMALSDPSMRRRQAAMRVLTPEAEDLSPQGPSATPRLV